MLDNVNLTLATANHPRLHHLVSQTITPGYLPAEKNNPKNRLFLLKHAQP